MMDSLLTDQMASIFWRSLPHGYNELEKSEQEKLENH